MGRSHRISELHERERIKNFFITIEVWVTDLDESSFDDDEGSEWVIYRDDVQVVTGPISPMFLFILN